MKKAFWAILLIGFISSCKKDLIRGSGSITTITRNTESFSGIDVSGSGRVFISYGPEITVSLKGYSNLIPHYVTDVSNGILHLHYDDNTTVTNDNLEVYLTMPTFTSVNISGSANINATGDFENNNSLSLSCSGNGNITISRLTTNNYSIHSSGNSEINTLDVSCNNADIDISGSSEVSLSVSEKLNVRISGSGKVSYKGDPSEVTSDISGSGALEKL